MANELASEFRYKCDECEKDVGVRHVCLSDNQRIIKRLDRIVKLLESKHDCEFPSKQSPDNAAS